MQKRRGRSTAGRQVAGGYSARHDERHARRGHVRTNAPDWGGVPAAAVWQAIQAKCKSMPGLSQGDCIMQALTLRDSMRELEAAVRASCIRSAADRAIAVLTHHSVEACKANLKAGTVAARPMTNAVMRRPWCLLMNSHISLQPSCPS